MSLTLDNIAFLRNNQILFHSVSFGLKPSEMLQITGANGSGKSTLLRIIAGYLLPEQGDILWQGKSIFQQMDDYQQEIHYLGHQNALRPQLTVFENLEVIGALQANKAEKARVLTILQRLELEHTVDRQAHSLSAGQKRRLAFARLLLNPRKIWILDEPTTALDAPGQILLTALLDEHKKTNGIVIVATHQLTEKMHDECLHHYPL